MNAIIPILLLPEHVKPTPPNLPLLKAIQKVLNDSYTATYCTHPEIFGTTHLRMADPAQLADIIGTDGFTIVLVRVTSDGSDQQPQLCEVLATGSVKDFGEGDVETYAQWSKNRSGSEWEIQGGNQERSGGATERRTEEVRKLEVTAFAVSPHCQAVGLGAQILREIKWLVASDGHNPKLRNITAESAAVIHELSLSNSATTFPLQAIDLNRWKEITASAKIRMSEDVQETAKRLVLMAIRELGNESYYRRRGFKTTWSGTVPVGGFRTRKGIEAALKGGVCDLVGIGRPAVLNPDFPRLIMDDIYSDKEARELFSKVPIPFLARLLKIRMLGGGAETHYFRGKIHRIAAGLVPHAP